MSNIGNYIRSFFFDNEKRALKRLRKEFAYFGLDLSYLNDQELIRNFHQASKILSRSGCSVSEVAEAQKEFSNLGFKISELPTVDKALGYLFLNPEDAVQVKKLIENENNQTKSEDQIF